MGIGIQIGGLRTSLFTLMPSNCALRSSSCDDVTETSAPMTREQALAARELWDRLDSRTALEVDLVLRGFSPEEVRAVAGRLS